MQNATKRLICTPDRAVSISAQSKVVKIRYQSLFEREGDRTIELGEKLDFRLIPCVTIDREEKDFALKYDKSHSTIDITFFY